jgi:hypothetical protein
MVNLFFFPL